MNSSQKTVTGHIHIICYGDDDFRLHKHCRGWTCIEKQLQDIPISYVIVMMTLDYIYNCCHGWTHTEKRLQNILISCVIVMITSDYIIVVTVELILKNGCRNIHILRNYQIWLVWLPNRHFGWIRIKKLVLVIYNMYHVYSI